MNRSAVSAGNCDGRSVWCSGTFRRVNAFHVLGGLLALWALLVSFLGITREGFPVGRAQERLVAAISVLLVVGTIGAAIYTSANEDHGEDGHESALLR